MIELTGGGYEGPGVEDSGDGMMIGLGAGAIFGASLGASLGG